MVTDSSPQPLNPSELAVSWQDIHNLSLSLGRKLRNSGRTWKRIVAVTRGGMVPACIIARELDIRLVDSISVDSYDEQHMKNVHILSEIKLNYDDPETLVIDDLSDSGNTFKALRALWPQATYACLFVKPEGRPQADFYINETAQNCWIFLPWESQEFPEHIKQKIGGHLL